ncbi:MAG: hypothetical protein ABIH38_02165, partial [Patescibacteria group bacterium]
LFNNFMEETKPLENESKQPSAEKLKNLRNKTSDEALASIKEKIQADEKAFKFVMISELEFVDKKDPGA